MDQIEVTVQSILPSEEPQGRFNIKIDPQSTVGDLIKVLCRDSGTAVRAEYGLRSKGNDLLDHASILANTGIQDGAFLHWTVEGVETKKNPFVCNTFWFLAIISFTIGVVGLTAVCILRFKTKDPVNDYAIVFDAGSTHTSMFLYKWDGAKYKGTAIAAQFGEKCDGEGKGIAKFANNPSAAGQSLAQCLEQAKKAIPSDKHAGTPIYLGATAGMRLLKEANESASAAVLESVRATFKKSPFNVGRLNQSVRILSGSEEGTFSWITSNYLANAFKVKQPEVNELLALSILPTIGALDMGGASTQITFVPAKGTKIPEGFSKEVVLYGETFTLYTHSYLCYGVTEVIKRISAALIQRSKNDSNIEHPCLPLGYEMVQTQSELFQSPCVSGKSAIEVFGFAFKEPSLFSDKNYTFTGLGHPGQCSDLLNTTLFNKTHCSYDHCSFNNVYQPPVVGPFYAFSAYYYVSSFLNLTRSSSNYNHSDLVMASQGICTTNWTELQQIPTSKIERSMLMWYCLESIYINQLLYDNYLIDDSLWTSVSFVSNVSNAEVGWTLGFVLNESDHYDSHFPSDFINTLTFALLLVLFVLFFVACVGLTVQGCRKFKARKQTYRRLSHSYGAI